MTTPRTGPKPMEVVRAAHALAYQTGIGAGYSEKFRMYAFLVTVDGYEKCEARAIAYGTRLSHSRVGDCVEAARGNQA